VGTRASASRALNPGARCAAAWASVWHSWKRVSITISSDEVGVFEVNGKFMGVNLYTTELRLEDLLQRQFDKVQTMTLFGTAVVNVNLLLYLINKKFYV